MQYFDFNYNTNNHLHTHTHNIHWILLIYLKIAFNLNDVTQWSIMVDFVRNLVIHLVVDVDVERMYLHIINDFDVVIIDIIFYYYLMIYFEYIFIQSLIVRVVHHHHHHQ